MDLSWDDAARAGRFEDYIEGLAGALGHKDRDEPFRHYCAGLLLPGSRKSVEPMAARLSPHAVSAEHQSLLHFVGQSPWSAAALLSAVRGSALPALERQGAIEAWIVDDTGFPKKGRHSAGVARQYCGQLGKQDNCQVAVSLSVASAASSLPVAWRLYLPKAWAEDAARRAKAGVPEDVRFQSKPQIALDQIAMAAGCPDIPKGVVVVDAGYGNEMDFRLGVADLGLCYVAGIRATTTLWAPGTGPLAPSPPRRQGRAGGRAGGRPQTRLQHPRDQAPVSAKTLAEGLSADHWRDITWREGVAGPLCSRFAALRLRPAHRDRRRCEPWPEEWLLIEWPEGEAEPTKYWLANLPEDTSIERLVHLAKLRWRIERDYRELKQELGLGHYEGRGWRGFHHHAALCIAAYGFLLKERIAIPPSGPRNRPLLQEPALPEGFQPRGAADPTRAAHPDINCHSAPDHRRGAGKKTAPMSMLSPSDPRQNPNHTKFMTQ
jgi:SRSO17 transposase